MRCGEDIMKARIIISFLLCTTFLTFSKNSFVDINSDNIKLIETKEMRFCYITFVKVDGKTYLVKQKKPFNKLLGVVRDSITAYIAESFNIAHQVEVIPADKSFPGKIRKHWPATIHTVAPGFMIKKQNTPYRKMNIKQAEKGFRRDMLPWMIKHPQLVIIVALDTFLCNHDRHRGNLFYNNETDSFCAIDMDSAFKYNLAALACKNFTKMFKTDVYSFTKKEILALIKYKDALEFLLEQHHPNDTIAMYDEFCEKAGFVKGSELYIPRISLEIERNREMIKQSYKDVKALIVILNDLIIKAIKSKKSLKDFVFNDTNVMI